ncbi:YeeE/YedE family protein [Halobaculum magnesiiphilum]|uniref:YeeE/YedE family protein n=1 Tax=Halobaculum magnesiiphilum TaxID=1017351 RepID=A0A8T8WHZ9_9EURY|nr:YeeE/YedE family protein [Halobaculum magnesiiphilum]QZP39481.1 YeeE/YedE family protein [Halobaculum magnesiiphilum]
MADTDRHPLFMPLIALGGLVFGFGLGFSHMARPEVVLDFLQFEDIGLLFVMFGGALVSGTAYFLAPKLLDGPALTNRRFERRLKSFDNNVLVGGAVFGVGWGLSGICPGAAYASLGVGNLPILWAIAGMFIGAYAQGLWRSRDDASDASPAGTD